jgi:hypothetical protein
VIAGDTVPSKHRVAQNGLRPYYPFGMHPAPLLASS